jgi:hypothetical protein
MKRLHKRMYAVSLERVGIIAGTMSYSRREAIERFCGADFINEWENFKRNGYRTVMARVQVIMRPSSRI